MRISDVIAMYPSFPQPLAGWRKALWQIVVRVETDSGHVGWGYGGGGRASLPIINGHFRELLLDAPLNHIDDISAIWDQLYHASIPYGRKGVAIMALSGLDLALWDVVGKAQEAPVYELLGGLQQPTIPAYATGRDSQWYAELGYQAHKLPHRWNPELPTEPQYQTLYQQMSALRALFGSESKLMLDGYMSWDAHVTHQMAAALADLDIYWFEDVTTPDQLEEQAALCQAVKPILIAGGEHEFTEHGFLPLAQRNALDIWQPDITWCGGMTPLLRIAALANQYNTPVILHRGGEVWGVHAIAAGICAPLGEVLPGRRDDDWPLLWQEEPIPVDGLLTPGDAPGFGVEPNAALL